MGVVPTIDGLNNNLLDSAKGSILRPLIRNVPAAYADGFNSQRDGPNTRNVSNFVFTVPQDDGGFSPFGYSDMLTFWGQFIDHDIDLSLTNGTEPANVPMPPGDPFFDPFNTGKVTMGFVRSTFVLDAQGVRQQINNITSYLDASVVYSSDAARTPEIRTFTGGRMSVSSIAGLNDGPVSDMPPRNKKNLNMNNASQKVATSELYLFGDVRGNENPGVLFYHTLFIREHNRIADIFAAKDKTLNDTQLFELGRKWVRAEFQAISETQYFPLIVGPNSVPPYTGYRPDIDPSIQAPFSVAAFRYGHSEGNEVFYRLDEQRNVIPEGNALMENVFFDNRWLDFGISCIARGMALQRQQRVDATVVSPLRNFLYGQPGAGGFDLTVRNLQRGRDHGMGPLNEVRKAYNLPPYVTFDQITKHQPTIDALVAVYNGNISDIDLYAGGLAEDQVKGANVGATFQAIIRDQYVRFRDGDRFWWNQPNVMFTPAELDELKALTLSRIVLLNTGVLRYPCNPFIASAVNNCDKSGIINDIGAAGSLTAAPFLVALLAVLAFLF